MVSPHLLTRRHFLDQCKGLSTLGFAKAMGASAMGASAVGLSLSGCSEPKDEVPNESLGDGEAFEYIDPKRASKKGTIEWAVSGKWRQASDKARDKFRHPIEMTNFFEIRPSSHVLDLWPGTGYMTDILAPYLKIGKGRYSSALLPQSAQSNSDVRAFNEQYRRHFTGKKSLYGEINITHFGPETVEILASKSQDVVLFLLVLHDWMAAGIAEKAFLLAASALKSGGVLGIEQHRGDIGHVQDPAATNGYVQEPFVQQLAKEAGLIFVDSSEANANPRDDKEHPFGVWTLPPQRLTAPRGQPINPNFDSTLYDSIGESDRMLLKFRKP